MNMQFLNDYISGRRSESLKNSPQLTLGEMILILEPMLNIERTSNECNVVFDFEYLFPNSLNSWRGSYAELSLGFCSHDDSKDKPFSLQIFYQLLKDAVGKTFYGYKGGDFVMSKHTPVWVANWGNSGSTAVVGIKDDGYQIILLTALCEF